MIFRFLSIALVLSTGVCVAQAPVVSITINGQPASCDPAPVLRGGSVLVPLRGVLEQLGAKVEFDAATRQITVTQNGKAVALTIGQATAEVAGETLTLNAPPSEIGGRVFVPLGAVARLFGFQTQWLGLQRVVEITDSSSVPPIDHDASVAKYGAFGVTIDFTVDGPEKVSELLDTAQKAGATFIKTRFDWATLEPARGAAFGWPLYDRVVREARQRNMGIVGVLGNSTQWASQLDVLRDPHVWRNAPPKATEMTAWRNYVKRTVGRYRADVHAWQVWENPTTALFRSSDRNYRIVVRAGVEAARESDPKAILLAADRGGVDLDFVDSMKRNGLTARVDGVMLYPASQWQAGLPASPEAMLRPAARLTQNLMPLGPSARYFWTGGLAMPAIENLALSGASASAGPLSKGLDEATRKRLEATFTPQAQADYLMRAAVLGLASGSEKVVWDALRDAPDYEVVQPINPLLGSGLQMQDGTPRPAMAAFATASRLLSGKPFIGPVRRGPDGMALLFGDGQDNVLAVWPLGGKISLTTKTDAGPADGLLPISTEAKVLDSTGKEIAAQDGVFVLNGPAWVTAAGADVAAMARAAKDGPLMMTAAAAATREEVRATFVSEPGAEVGITWRKYSTFRGVALKQVTLGDRTGLSTEYSRDIWNPADCKPFIFLDVDDDFLYCERARPVRVTIDVHKAGPLGSILSPATAGFCLEYDSANGPERSDWKDVEEGTGWTTYSFDLPNPSFANRGGFDMLINTFGAKQDIVFGAVTISPLPITTQARADAGSAAR